MPIRAFKAVPPGLREWTQFWQQAELYNVTVTDDIVIDLATKGLVLKDTQDPPHYWRLTVDTSGTLVTTDLGTTHD